MKKLFLSLAVVMSVSLFSCNGGNGENADSTKVEGEQTEAAAPAEEVAAPAEEATEAPAEEATEAPAEEAAAPAENA